MRIAQLTPGTGNFHCGSCMRDNALVNALRDLGHDALMIPMYLPTVVDEPGHEDKDIYYGGINVYLEQKGGLLGKLPNWLRRKLDSPKLLNWAAGRSDMTKPTELGEITISMLRGEDGRQTRELDKLVEHLRDDLKPDVVCLSNVLLIGLARQIRERLNVPVVCTMHGEHSFIDDLPSPYNDNAWALLKERARDVDAFIGVSQWYGDLMRERLAMRDGQLHVVLNGILLDGYSPAESLPHSPTIGYLARICWVKGIEFLVDAFLELRWRERIHNAKLRICGSMTPGDEKVVQKVKQRLDEAGMADDVEFLPNVTRDEKIDFLRSLSVLSVPTRMDESFGLYVLEAWAAGVPVVQPRRGAFPELIEPSGAGALFDADDPKALAAAWEELLTNPAEAREMGMRGRDAVLKQFSVERMAADALKVYEQVVGTSQRTAPREGEAPSEP